MSKALDNIEKSTLDYFLNNPDLAREELKNSGYDVNSLVNDGLNIIKQLKFKQKVQDSKNEISLLLDKAKGLLLEGLKNSREEALIILSQYQVKVQYRNIVEFSDDELNDILKDVELVKLIEDLEKNSK